MEKQKSGVQEGCEICDLRCGMEKILDTGYLILDAGLPHFGIRIKKRIKKIGVLSSCHCEGVTRPKQSL